MTRIEGRYVELVPVDDYERFGFLLRECFTDEHHTADELRDRLADAGDVLCKVFIRSRQTGRYVGTFVAYDYVAGTARISFGVDPRVQRSVWPLEGAALAIEQLFALDAVNGAPLLHTLFAYVSDENAAQFLRYDHGLFEEVVPNVYAIRRDAWSKSVLRIAWRRAMLRSERELAL